MLFAAAVQPTAAATGVTGATATATPAQIVPSRRAVILRLIESSNLRGPRRRGAAVTKDCGSAAAGSTAWTDNPVAPNAHFGKHCGPPPRRTVGSAGFWEAV